MNIAIYNQKGGTGKTTTAVSLAAALGAGGFKTTLVDLCPQGDATLHLGYKPGPGYDPFDTTVEPVAIKENVRLIPAGPKRLSIYDLEGGPRLYMGYLGGGETLILDCPPSASRLSSAAILAAHKLIVPISPGFLSYAAVDAVTQYVDELARSPYMKQKPEMRLLVTQYDERRRVDRSTMEALDSRDISVFNTLIPVNTDLNMASSVGKDIFSYAPRSRGAQAYRELAQEVIEWLRLT